MAARLILLSIALGVAACASLTGVDAYEVTPDAPLQPDGGAPVVMGGITISTTTLAFPAGVCSETKTLPITITNGRDAAVPLAVTPVPGFSIDGNGGSIPAHGSVSLQVNANSSGNGTMQIRAGDVTFDVTYTASFTGAHLTVDPPKLDFGEIRHDTVSAPQTVTFANDGDEDVSVTGLDGTKDFALGAPVKVPAHGQGTASFTMTSGPAGDPITESPAVTLDRRVCAGATALLLKGHRTATDVTVSATDLDDVKCSAPGSSVVTLTNYSTTTLAHFAIAGGGTLSGYPPSGDIPLAVDGTAGTATINVSSPSALGDYQFDLTITDDATPPTPARTVTVRRRVVGARLMIDQSDLVVAAGATGSKPMKNIGNLRVCVHYLIDDGDPTGPGITLEPDEQFDANVDGDVKVTVAANYSKARTRIRITAVPCPGTTAPAPLCPSGDPRFDVKLPGGA